MKLAIDLDPTWKPNELGANPFLKREIEIEFDEDYLADLDPSRSDFGRRERAGTPHQLQYQRQASVTNADARTQGRCRTGRPPLPTRGAGCSVQPRFSPNSRFISSCASRSRWSTFEVRASNRASTAVNCASTRSNRAFISP